MLIDDLLPTWDFAERHEVRVRAAAPDVLEALRGEDLARSPLVRILLALRGMGTCRSGDGPRAFGRPRRLTLDDLPGLGFIQLGQVPGREVALGIAGRFWTFGGDRQALDAEGFRQFRRPGFAKAVWNFSVEGERGGETRLATETRILCLDQASRRRFRLYWTAIRPFSGLLRREMLRAVRHGAEARARGRRRAGGVPPAHLNR